MKITGYSKILPVPSTQATELIFSEVSDTQMRVTWTNGNGRGVILVANQGSSVNSNPINNTTYSDNPIFGSGSQIGAANYVVYKGTGNTVLVTGLTANTAIYFRLYGYNLTIVGTEKYNPAPSTNNPRSQNTQAVVVAPTVQSTLLDFDGDRHLTWTSGNGVRRIVVARSGGAVNSNPINSISYTGNRTFGLGSEIGTGNFVVYDGTGNFVDILGLAFSTTYGIRIYEYNISLGLPLYYTATATGNPLSHATIADEHYYLGSKPIGSPVRYAPNTRDISHAASKVYSGSPIETATERLLFIVSDNNSGPTNEFNYDQTFLRYQPIASAPDDYDSWQWHADINGEPIPVIEYGYVQSNGTRFQNWLGQVTNMGGGVLRGYFSYNVGNLAARYSVGYAESTDSGRTWTYDFTPVIQETGGGVGSWRNMWQFQNMIFDSDRGTWLLMSQNANVGTEGRYCATDIWESTDGATGKAFTRIYTNVTNGTDIDYGGFGLFGSWWKDGGLYYCYATAGDVPAYRSNPANSHTIYQFLQNQVVLISSSNLQNWIIERIVYTADQQVNVGVFPCSKRISHGGNNYIVVNTFLWKLEDATTEFDQVTIDIKILTSSNAVVGGEQLIGNEKYAGEVYRLFKPHQSHVNDTPGSTTLNPYEVITAASGTIVGSPTQYNFNRIVASAGNYVSFPDFSHDLQYLGFKGIADFTITFDSTTRGIYEKEGVFKILWNNGSHIEIWLYGSTGGIKKYRATLNLNTQSASSEYLVNYNTIGFTARLNAGATDIDFKLNANYIMDLPVTKIQDDVFTSIADTANALTIGRVNGVSSLLSKSVGPCIIFSGNSFVNQANWLNNEYI